MERLNPSIIPDVDLLLPQRKGILLPDGSKYEISDRATHQLTAYVVDLERHPKGKLVGKVDFDNRRPLLDRAKLIDSLPPGLSEQQFMDAVRLSNLVECATESYAAVFYESGTRYGTPWLSRFTEQTWVPDELQHADPFKRILLEAGYSEDEIDRQVRRTQEKIYEHTSGDTPVQMTQFGVIQEEVTDVWHGLVGSLLRRVAPLLAGDVFSVKKRETFHKMWYKDLTALQVRDNPVLRHLATDTVYRFEMPGNKLVPELQKGSVALIPVMGGDLRDLERGLVRLISGCLAGSTSYLGEAIIELLYRKSENTGVSPARLLREVSRIPILGHTVSLLIGQVVQQREGMKPKSPLEKMVWNITQPLRSLIVNRAEDLTFVT